MKQNLLLCSKHPFLKDYVTPFGIKVDCINSKLN